MRWTVWRKLCWHHSRQTATKQKRWQSFTIHDGKSKSGPETSKAASWTMPWCWEAVGLRCWSRRCRACCWLISWYDVRQPKRRHKSALSSRPVYRDRNDSAEKYGITGDHPETPGASAGTLEAVFITKRPGHQGRRQLRYQKNIIQWNAAPFRLSERHCRHSGSFFKWVGKALFPAVP